ncbi:MAG: AarF/ABC1/UbiB kinase family protein, partial [Myxococcales bacterium]|nr:AarF/ABC1/UbiB kinase family protein [Myxococcales bacterium]
MSDSGSRKIPGSRLGRLARLARVGARTGANMLLNREAAADEVARRAAEALGTLRGVAAKVGQMAGYVDGVIPEGQRDAYEKWMQTLLAAAPASSPAAVRQLVEEELGAPLDRLFAEWDERPIASASIGQVHRARLPEGDEVAVKVQHPGVARAVESDLQNAGLLERTVAVVGGSKLESRRILEEVRTRFREELNYETEAARQREFAAFFQDDPQVVIPRVYDARSSRRVLTSQFIRGRGFQEACAAPEEERAAWARAQWRFVYRGTLVGGMFNADPHPGNYFFLPEGQVAFIDFGCVQP